MTSRTYNERSGRAVICPISLSAGDWPFNVPLPTGLKTHGMVLVDQVRAVHGVSRLFRRIESAPPQLMLEVRLMPAMILGIDVNVVTSLRNNR